MRRIFLYTLLTAALVAAGAAVAAYANGNPHGDKVTICHAAGRAGTTHYETLTIGHQAVYGPGGHFNENGTPQAGHEQDYLGACQGDETETTPTEPNPCDTSAAAQYDECEQPPTTPTPPRVCPDGKPPTPGEGAYDPNDDCKRPPTVVATAPPATTPPAVTPPPVVTPPAVTPPQAPKPTAKPPVKAKPEPKAPPKLTGNPKVDKCVPKAGLLHCKVGKDTITVVPGSG